MGARLGSDMLQLMFTHWGEVRQRTYFDEVAGVNVLFGGEVVEVSHVLILGRETQKRAIFHPLPRTRGRGDTFVKPFHLLCELSRQALWVQWGFLLASMACVWVVAATCPMIKVLAQVAQGQEVSGPSAPVSSQVLPDEVLGFSEKQGRSGES